MTIHAHSHRDGSKQTDKTTLCNSESESVNKIVLFEIALEMRKADLPKMFIVDAVRAALDFEGISDLMKLWRDEKEPEEKNEIVADIQDMLDACLQKEKLEESYIKFNDLETISKHIRAFKDSLLSTVVKKGGITHLSELTEIPQPSLSRFFNSNAMPQRSTLLKIAKALELDEIQIFMSTSIRISDEEYTAAKKAAKAEHRSIQGQIEYWSQIGRCALDNPDLPIEMIKELLSTGWSDGSDATPFIFGQ